LIRKVVPSVALLMRETASAVKPRLRIWFVTP
jgi:hypothetical protein